MSNPEIGRVLRASTTGFAVGCRVGQLSIPAFGGLVKAQPVEAREAIYGLIYNMNIDDDPLVRRLVLAENPPVNVINDQRQNRLLPIEMSILAVGYKAGDEIQHGLPPRPPLNLDPVVLVKDLAEIRTFTAPRSFGDGERLGYLRLILRNVGTAVPVDQLLVAHIVNMYELRGHDVAWAVEAVQELIELLRSSYDILIPTMEALSDALPDLTPVLTPPAT
ncbi:MAG: hypothetical protein KDE48_23285 [Anaerolineales bacterium]|nr:hypothetical protein [Anaerolineales bacterium]